MMQNGNSSLLFLTVADINQTVTNLMALGGAEHDDPIKYEVKSDGSRQHDTYIDNEQG